MILFAEAFGYSRILFKETEIIFGKPERILFFGLTQFSPFVTVLPEADVLAGLNRQHVIILYWRVKRHGYVGVSLEGGRSWSRIDMQSDRGLDDRPEDSRGFLGGRCAARMQPKHVLIDVQETISIAHILN